MVEDMQPFQPEFEKYALEFSPCIIVFAGLPLSGKTTLGQGLETRSNAVYLDVDSFRRNIVGHTQRLSDERELWLMRAAYESKFERAQEIVTAGLPVILGATYSRETYLQGLQCLTEETQAPVRAFMFHASDKVVGKRIEERRRNGSVSVIQSIELFNLIRSRYDPPISVDYHIDTDASINNTLQQVVDHLQEFRIIFS